MSDSNAAQNYRGMVVWTSNLLKGVVPVDFSSINPSQYARDYLKSCYPEQGPYHDSMLIVDFITKHQQLIGHQSRMLDIGSAAVISYANSLSRFIDEVHFSDVYGEHLALVREFQLDGVKSHNWRNHTAYILAAENQPINENSISKREADFRAKIPKNGLLVGDLTLANPLQVPIKYPVVSCFYASEQAATSGLNEKSLSQAKTNWFQVMSNLSSLVEDDGHLVLAFVHDSNFYVTHDENKNPSIINIAQINKNDVEQALFKNNFDLTKSHIEIVKPRDLEEEGLSEVLLVYSQKRSHPSPTIRAK